MKMQGLFPEVVQLKKGTLEGLSMNFELTDTFFKMQNMNQVFLLFGTMALYN